MRNFYFYHHGHKLKFRLQRIANGVEHWSASVPGSYDCSFSCPTGFQSRQRAKLQEQLDFEWFGWFVAQSFRLNFAWSMMDPPCADNYWIDWQKNRKPRHAKT